MLVTSKRPTVECKAALVAMVDCLTVRYYTSA